MFHRSGCTALERKPSVGLCYEDALELRRKLADRDVGASAWHDVVAMVVSACESDPFLL